jgi:hypothetical protein
MTTMFDEYYKLKEAYETSVRNQKLDILKKKGGKKDIQKRLLSLKPKCVNCKREGGSIFSSAFDEKALSRVLSAKCGVVSNPCDLNIEIQAGSYEIIQDILSHDEKELESVKQLIIEGKNKLLFGYSKTDETIDKFEELKQQVNDYTGSIEYYSKIYYDKVDNKQEKEQLNKLLRDSYESIHQIKEYIRKFNEEDDESQTQNVVSAVKVYVEQLKPQLEQMMHLKYKQNAVVYDEDDETYHLIQKPQTINSLEVALVDAKVVKNKRGEASARPVEPDNEGSEQMESDDEGYDNEGYDDEESNDAINIGDEVSIDDDSYELLE